MSDKYCPCGSGAKFFESYLRTYGYLECACGQLWENDTLVRVEPSAERSDATSPPTPSPVEKVTTQQSLPRDSYPMKKHQ